MEIDNPHGAGVAWETPEGTIRFVRGLKAAQIHAMQEAGEMTYPYLLHFRWATHGGVVDELTHPFPVGPRALMGELDGFADKVVIHNGTWGGYSRAAENHINVGNYDLPEEVIDAGSDTAVAAWLAMWDETVLNEVQWATAVAEMRETTDEFGNPSRTMDITTRGTWSDHEGNYYSNLNWLPSNKWYSSSDYSSSLGRSYVSKYSSFSDDDFYSKVPDPEGERAAENAAWETAIRPFGWRSVTANACYGLGGPVEREKRKSDAYYVGRYNDICVRPDFYDVWWAEKDHYKPDNITNETWYNRFDHKELNVYGESKKSASSPSNQGTKQDAPVIRGLGGPDLDASTQNPHAVAMGNGGENAPDRREYPDFASYLRAKYGAEGASQILDCFPGEREELDPGSEPDPYEALDKAWTQRVIADPPWLNDPDDDLVSDDGATVNAWLAKQMVAK